MSRFCRAHKWVISSAQDNISAGGFRVRSFESVWLCPTCSKWRPEVGAVAELPPMLLSV